MHLLIPSLSANDYIEIFAKSFDNAAQNSVKIGTTTLFLEKIASARTIFSATATRTVASTDLNPDTASQLYNGLRKLPILVLPITILPTVTTSS